MSSAFSTGWCIPGWNFDTSPYIAAIPRQFRQGDSAVWMDVPFMDRNATEYDSTGYTLKYVLAGPIAAPVVLTAAANGLGWKTTLNSTTSAGLNPGTYSWTAYAFLIATGDRLTVDDGELTVDIDLLSAGGNYDGRSLAQIALAQAKAAFSQFSVSGGAVKMYRIGSREMVFNELSQIQTQVNFWKVEVEKEAMIDNPKRRFVNVRLDRIR